MSDSASTAAFVDVAALRDVPDGRLLGVKLPDGTLICLYNQDGNVGAVGGTCTHARYPMSQGWLQPDGTIVCGWHGSRFDCRTGAVRHPPAAAPLPVYDVRVESDRVLVGPLRRAARVAEREA